MKLNIIIQIPTENFFVYKQVIEVVENQTFDFANYRVFMVALSLILFFGSYQVVLYYKTLKK